MFKKKLIRARGVVQTLRLNQGVESKSEAFARHSLLLTFFFIIFLHLFLNKRNANIYLWMHHCSHTRSAATVAFNKNPLFSNRRVAFSLPTHHINPVCHSPNSNK